MKQIVIYTILPICLFLVSCASRAVNAQSPQAPVFSVSTRNSDDEVTFEFKDNLSTIRIHSPLGIGSAVFKLESGDMPAGMLIQLYVQGLEDFKLISDPVSVAASVSSSAGLKTQSQRKISGNSEQPLRSFDPLWLHIQNVTDSDNIQYFEISVPKAFIQQSGDTFEIQWIDFYR